MLKRFYGVTKKNFNAVSKIIESNQKNVKTAEKALNEAESLVGYPGKYFNIQQNLISDYSLNLTKKDEILSSNPHLKVLLDLTSTQNCDLQSYGLITLLVSQIGNADQKFENFNERYQVQESQKTLAECLEWQRLSFIFHEKIKNYQNLPKHGNEFCENSQQMKGQKLSLLGGDFLMAKAMHTLFGFRDSINSENVSIAIRHYVESQFIGERDNQSIALPSDPSKTDKSENLICDLDLDDIENNKKIQMSQILGYPKREWIYRNVYSSGSLLGTFLRWTMKFSNASEEIQQQAYRFGKNYALTTNLYEEILPFTDDENSKMIDDKKINLVSAPVLFHLDNDSELYNEIAKGIESVDKIDFKLIHQKISQDGTGVARSRMMMEEFGVKSLNDLNAFPDSKAKESLQNLILAMLNH